jgi:phenylacetate-CoA ligase
MTTGRRLRETARDEREKKQVELLRQHVAHALTTPFYRARLAGPGITPAAIRSLADLPGLPLTAREDLDRHGLDLWAVSPDQVADLALTSGTTGPPVQVPYTAGDLERLAYNEAMSFYGAGTRTGDRCLICVTLDRCFIAGLAYYRGIVRLGATAIRSGSGQPARQWDLITMLRPTVLVGVPTFLLQIALWAKERHFRPEEAGIKRLVIIGEPVRRPDMRLTPLGEELTRTWACPVCASYGATELQTGICECTVGRGGHLHPELCLAEIIDEQGNPLGDGLPGELVLTPLGVRGFPLLRFRTGDIARKYSEPCACGWQTERIGPIEGRVAQRLKMKGTTLYPEAVFQILQEVPGVRASYLEVRASYDLSDNVRVVVGGNGSLDPREIETLLQARLRVRPEVLVQDIDRVTATMTGGGERKAKRFFDFRNR